MRERKSVRNKQSEARPGPDEVEDPSIVDGQPPATPDVHSAEASPLSPRTSWAEAVSTRMLSSLHPGTKAGESLSTPPDARDLEKSGDLRGAMRAFRELGRFEDAGRLAAKLGRHGEAARDFCRAGMHYQSAACYVEARSPEEAYAELLRLASDDPNYRKACICAIRLACRLRPPLYSLQSFLEPFLRSGTHNPREIAALFELGQLYEELGFPAGACDAYGCVAAIDPGFHDCGERLVRLGAPDPGLAAAAFAPTAPPPRMAGKPHHSRRSSQGDAFAPPGRRQRNRSDNSESDGTDALGFGPADQDLRLGTTINNRYRIVRKLGVGGMATVYQAADFEIGEDIAIKLFHLTGDEPRLLSRFRQELSLARKLTHPNIVRLHDIGSYRHRRFITMELLYGRPLSAIIDNSAPLSLAQGLDYILQACAGLGAAHEQGVVHRDVKPENLFVTTDGVLKVMDFGIAKHQAGVKVTQAGVMAGSPAYMSPEQAVNFTDVNHLTDIYALGIVTYEVFTGTMPFNSPDVVRLLMMHRESPVPPPRQRAPGIPESLERVILRMLEKSPEQRIQTCRELAEELTKIRTTIGWAGYPMRAG